MNRLEAESDEIDESKMELFHKRCWLSVLLIDKDLEDLLCRAWSNCMIPPGGILFWHALLLRCTYPQ